jgi:hypothetical protein
MRNRQNNRWWLYRGTTLGSLALLLFVMTAPLTDAATSHTSQRSSHTVATQAHLVAVVAHDFFFQMPTQVPAGLTEFVFINHGAQSHMMQIFKLKPGVTDANLLKALSVRGSIKPLYAVASAAGGVNSIEPRHQAHELLNLSAGRYDVVCFDATPQGVPHFALGMRKLFTVSTSASARLDPDTRLISGAPTSNGTIILRNYAILLPSAIKTRGAHTFQIVNQGNQFHEAALLRLNAGKSANDVLASLRANREPPATEVGGSAAISPGQTAWMETDLGAGTYVVLCNVPDIKTDMPHALMGMITQFVVR